MPAYFQWYNWYVKGVYIGIRWSCCVRFWIWLIDVISLRWWAASVNFWDWRSQSWQNCWQLVHYATVFWNWGERLAENNFCIPLRPPLLKISTLNLSEGSRFPAIVEILLFLTIPYCSSVSALTERYFLQKLSLFFIQFEQFEMIDQIIGIGLILNKCLDGCE